MISVWITVDFRWIAARGQVRARHLGPTVGHCPSISNSCSVPAFAGPQLQLRLARPALLPSGPEVLASTPYNPPNGWVIRYRYEQDRHS